MNITVTGSLGNISKPLTAALVKAGHQVTVISSNPSRIAEIESLGAKAAIGSVHDLHFLTEAFKGADAVYTMTPPDFSAADYRAYMNTIARNYAAAIRDSGVRRVVNLSSIGAHLPSGTGPIAGLYDAEQIMAELKDVAITHLRAAFFYVNFYANADMIRHMGILGANYPAANQLVMVHPEDIAAAAAEELTGTNNGNSVRYVVSDVRTLQEVAAVLGTAIGRPELPWVEFTDEQSFAGMTQAGLPEEISRNYVEMGTAVRSGKLWEDYRLNLPQQLGKIKLEDFAKEFAAAY